MAGETQSTERRWPPLDPRELSRLHQLGLLGLLSIAVLPLVASTGAVGFVDPLLVLQVTGALFFAVYVMTWDVVSGYTGEISFGHALFIGVGAYTSALANVYLGVPLVASIPLGVVAAGVAGLLIGFPSLRVRGPYFSLITLVAPIILVRVLVYYAPVTGGETGLFGVETISFDPVANYYVAFGLFLLALVIFLAVTRSDAGEVLTAIREDEDAVVAVGLNPARYKLFVFVLSGAVGGLAGALFVSTYAQGIVTPSETLGLVLSIELIVAAILGGMGTITGAAVGGLFFYLLQTWLRGVDVTIPVVGAPVSELYFLIFAIVTLLFLFFMPQGILPRLVQEARRLGEREPGTDVATDGGRAPTTAAVASLRDGLDALFGGERR